MRRHQSEKAIDECLSELRAACRRNIDPAALQALAASLRPNFEHILNNPEGRVRWGEHGHLMRENGRHIGSLADFLAHCANADVVGSEQIRLAFELVSKACAVGAPASSNQTPADVEALLRASVSSSSSQRS